MHSTLGKGFADIFLTPYSEKFWTVHPREMTFEWAGNRVPKPANYQEWMHSTLGKGFADIFLTPYSEKFWTVHPREMTFEWRSEERRVGKECRCRWPTVPVYSSA